MAGSPRRTGHLFMYRNSLRFLSFLVAAFKSPGHHQRCQMRSRDWVFRRNFQLDLQLEDIHPRLDVHLVFRVAGFIRCDLVRLARTRWSAQSWRGVSRVLVRRNVDFCTGHLSASILVNASGVLRDRRYLGLDWAASPRCPRSSSGFPTGEAWPQALPLWVWRWRDDRLPVGS